MGCSKDGLTYESVVGWGGRPHKEMRDGKLQCSTCKEWKVPEDYYPASNTYHKRETRCKECTSKRQRCFYNSSFKRFLTSIAYAHRQNSRTYQGTARRKILHAESTVTPELLIALWEKQEGRCAVTGRPMTHMRGIGHCVKTNVSIDRIDSSIGYTADNIRLVCRVVNVMKWTSTDQEMVEWANAIVTGPVATGLSQCSKLSEPPEGTPRSEGERTEECLTM